MGHEVTGHEGLCTKMWEVAYHSGPSFAVEQQIVALRNQLLVLKNNCTHPQEMIRTTHHKFTQEWGTVTWQTDHCARCGGEVRSNDRQWEDE